MERATPVRKPHTSTADLLTWLEVPQSAPSASANSPRSATRPQQVSPHFLSHCIVKLEMQQHFLNGAAIFFFSLQATDGISKVLFGGQITEEEAESLNRRLQRYSFTTICGLVLINQDVKFESCNFQCRHYLCFFILDLRMHCQFLKFLK